MLPDRFGAGKPNQSEAPAVAINLNRVEYMPHTRGEKLRTVDHVVYLGVGEFGQSGMTAMRVRQAGRRRNQNIEVGAVRAITGAHGDRRVLETPAERWRLRAAEIRLVVEGTTEEWALPYFDAASSKYFKRDPEYRAPRDDVAEAATRRCPRGKGKGSPNSPPKAESTILTILAALITAGLFYWFLFR